MRARHACPQLTASSEGSLANSTTDTDVKADSTSCETCNSDRYNIIYVKYLMRVHFERAKFMTSETGIFWVDSSRDFHTLDLILSLCEVLIDNICCALDSILGFLYSVGDF